MGFGFNTRYCCTSLYTQETSRCTWYLGLGWGACWKLSASPRRPPCHSRVKNSCDPQAPARHDAQSTWGHIAYRDTHCTRQTPVKGRLTGYVLLNSASCFNLFCNKCSPTVRCARTGTKSYPNYVIVVSYIYGQATGVAPLLMAHGRSVVLYWALTLEFLNY